MKRKKTLKLENDIHILENKMNLNPTEFIQPSLNQKKRELENRRQDIVEGLLLRSQANWHENGESCSEYFCKLEKTSSINKTIFELINEKGNHNKGNNKITEQSYKGKVKTHNYINRQNQSTTGKL